MYFVATLIVLYLSAVALLATPSTVTRRDVLPACRHPEWVQEWSVGLVCLGVPDVHQIVGPRTRSIKLCESGLRGVAVTSVLVFAVCARTFPLSLYKTTMHLVHAWEHAHTHTASVLSHRACYVASRTALLRYRCCGHLEHALTCIC